MAQIRFEDIQENTSTQNNGPRIGFFSLRNHGDEAIVRIMHDSTDSFEIISTHQIEINGKYRRVNCCRNPHEPVDNCPLCATGKNVQQRFYIHLIQYTANENGQIVAEPKVWERPVSFATTIKNLIINYGPLSNSVFKIHRNGAARAMDTTYDIMYMPPQQFPESVYPKINDAFNGYSALGSIVLDKTPAEVVEFIQTGNFPMPKKETSAPTVNAQPQPATPSYIPPQGGYVAPATAPSETLAVQDVPVYTTTAPNVSNMSNAPKVERPVRYY